MPENYFLNTVELKSTVYTLPKGLKIDFRPGLNLIVGNNGCGKSMLFTVLTTQGYYRTRKVTMESPEYTGGKTRFYKFDAEKDNVRNIKDTTEHEDNLEFVLTSFFRSHGEVQLDMLNGLSKIKRSMIFLDEPEIAVSLKNIPKVISLLKETAQNNQLFVATHHPWIIESVENIYDMEKHAWVCSRDYITELSSEWCNNIDGIVR